jgi:hypothetical protein
VSGTGIGVGNVGRMEGLYKEGKPGRACSMRWETELTTSRLLRQLTARAHINASTENGPGLVVINADPNGRAYLILK